MPPLATVAAQTVGTPESRRAPAAAAPAPAPLPPEAMADADLRLAREYCLNIADPASDARIAWQKKVLAGIEQEIAKRLELLEAKTAEYQRWLARRDEFSKKAQESVVTIYAHGLEAPPRNWSPWTRRRPPRSPRLDRATPAPSERDGPTQAARHGHDRWRFSVVRPASPGAA
jgi:hypothetical protein